VLHPFDGADDVLEKRGAPPRYASVMWPVLIGIVLAAIAPKLFDLFNGFNPWIGRLVFPYVLLAARPEFGLNWKIATNFPQLVLLLQFPLEGLLTTINLRRRVSTGLAIGQLIFIHLIGAFVLFLLVAAQTR
jgi:hypothetical protein